MEVRRRGYEEGQSEQDGTMEEMGLSGTDSAQPALCLLGGGGGVEPHS